MENKDKPANVLVFDDSINGNRIVEIGLTKREYFAAMAMQGLMSKGQSIQVPYSNFAHSAIMMADELLKQLEK